MAGNGKHSKKLEEVDIEDLEDFEQELVERAREARDDKAYTPYDDFKVGAALIDVSDNVYVGANFEMYGRQSIHAERDAVKNALQDGCSELDVIVVSCEDEDGHIPCGSCLFALGEGVSDRNLEILADNGDSVFRTTLKEELPNAYIKGSRVTHTED